MNRYLLVAGEWYYPRSGTGDWIGCYSTYEEAKALVSKDNYNDFGLHCIVNGHKYDWYEIIDLQEWTAPTNEKAELDE